MDGEGGIVASYRSAVNMRRAQSLNEISSIDNTRRYPWQIVNKVRMEMLIHLLDRPNQRFARYRMK